MKRRTISFFKLITVPLAIMSFIFLMAGTAVNAGVQEEFQLALQEQKIEKQDLSNKHKTQSKEIRQQIKEVRHDRAEVRVLRRQLRTLLQEQRATTRLLHGLHKRDIRQLRLDIRRAKGGEEAPDPDHEFNALLELVAGVKLVDEDGVPVGGEVGIATFGDKFDVELIIAGISSSREIETIEFKNCTSGRLFFSLSPHKLLGEVVTGPEIAPLKIEFIVGPPEPLPELSLLKLDLPLKKSMLSALINENLCVPVVFNSHEESHPEGALTGNFIDHLRFEALEYLLDPSLLPEPTVVNREFETQGTLLELVVADNMALEQLGKAFFWDVQVGSDNKVACATCHNLAGVDWRTKNQFTEEPGNLELTQANFPLPDGSKLGSQGVLDEDFVRIVPGERDECENQRGDFRQRTGRQSPPIIDSAFNVFQFWDGRAHRFFNGENPFGPADKEAGVYKVIDGLITKDTNFLVDLSAQASQATGPTSSHVEMTCGPGNGARFFPQLGAKLLYDDTMPLGLQQVHAEDSLLGAIAHPGKGLTKTYAELIKLAFQEQYWDSENLVTLIHPHNNEPQEYSLMETNFAFIFGIAVQAYERTLLSGESKFDKFARGEVDLTEDEKEGFSRFLSGGTGCSGCHDGPLFSTATFQFQLAEPIEAMRLANSEGPGLYDSGFYNVGVTATGEDIGRARNDLPFGPIALSTLSNLGDDTQWPGLPILSEEDAKAQVKGHMKVPTLRNIELTAPYFHNGKYLTLEDVVAFYTRGGDFPDNENLDPDIVRIGQLLGKPGRQAKIAAWMRTLTDPRILRRAEPFDHPELIIPNGHTDELGHEDEMVTLDATGKEGLSDGELFSTLFDKLGGTIPDIIDDDEDEAVKDDEDEAMKDDEGEAVKDDEGVDVVV
jgi:cytochrome c peroxidase